MTKSDRRYPRVGDSAWHKSGLDPREVVAVREEDGEVWVKIDILGTVTDWLRAVNYEFEAPNHG